MRLYLLKNFNNYYNRQLKRFTKLSDYTDIVPYNIQDLNSFNIADGVSTEIVVNQDISCDYAILTDNNKILSRWYVLECQFIRIGQNRLTLRRDVIADFYNAVMGAPSLIKKGFVNTNDSAIYNKEDMQFNEIKKSEYLLKDETATPWIVGYLSSDFSDSQTTNDKVVSWEQKFMYQEISDEVFNALSTGYTVDYSKLNDYRVTLREHTILSTSQANRIHTFTYNDNGYISSKVVTYGGVQGNFDTKASDFEYSSKVKDVANALGEDAQRTLLRLSVAGVLGSYKQGLDYSDLEQYNGKSVTYGANKFRVNIIKNTGTFSTTADMTSSHIGNSTKTYIVNGLRDLFYKGKITWFADSLQQQIDTLRGNIEMFYDTYSIQLIPEEANKYFCHIHGTRAALNRQPYNMFAMPYNDYVAYAKSGNTYSDFNMSGEANRAIANAISKTFSGSNALYDIQLVPYCPIRNALTATYAIDHEQLDSNTASGAKGIYYEEITKGSETGEVVSYLYWCTTDTFSFDINYANAEVIPSDPIEFKVANQCNKYRLCSPNYNGSFDFTPATNNGGFTYNIDITYKPYTPYIHVKPLFGGLYGNVQTDARGLICGGDFSLPQINDAWETYQLNNKAYDQQFNRNIESLELQQKYQRIGEIATAISGAVGAGTGAGMTSASLLGPAGIAVGAAAGVMSAGAGVADIAINDVLRKEAIDLKRDQYGYSLQNIQAVPTSLTRVGALNANNKLYPFIEIYTCTEEEKEALRNKLKYNGMTIERIGRVIDFIDSNNETFIQAKPIRLTQLADDYHMAQTISDELQSGLFFNTIIN